MSLSCDCGSDDFDWYYETLGDFTALNTRTRKRCCSCNDLIDKNATCLEFPRYRHPQDDIEERIHGDDGEIPLATWHMCEPCGDQYMNLTALGFCVDLGQDNMFDLLKEYQEMRKAG